MGVDWDPSAALPGTPEDVLEAIVNELDFTPPVSTHILQKITDRQGYLLHYAAGLRTLDDAYAAYVLVTFLPQPHEFTLSKALTDADSAASPWNTSTICLGVDLSPDQESVLYSVSGNDLTTMNLTLTLKQDPVLPGYRGLETAGSPQGDLTWLLEPNPFTSTGDPYLASWRNGILSPSSSGVPSKYDYTGIGNTLCVAFYFYICSRAENSSSTFTNAGGHRSSPGEWYPIGPIRAHSSAAPNVEAGLPTVPELTRPDTILGKRPRATGAEGTVGSGGLEAQGHDPRPRKKGKGLSKTRGIVEIAGSSSKAQHKSASQNPKRGINRKSKAVKHGAGGHAATSAQGLYDRFLPGPSVQQELTEAFSQELTWVEESTQGKELQQMGGTWQRQQQQVSQDSAGVEEGELRFPMPRGLRERYSKLLAATEADRERRAVNELRCRLCPHAQFSTWEGFKRHCDTTRVHPWEIYICDHCGDYFGRSDSFMRHSRRRPRVCQKMVPEKAEAKGRDIKQLHEDFKARMVRCLDDGEEIGRPFFMIVKAKYPGTSKKGVEDTRSQRN